MLNSFKSAQNVSKRSTPFPRGHFISFQWCRGSDNPDGLIVGGDKIALREAPYQAAILLLGGLHCGGTLLSMRIVITAAHCW